MSNFTFLKMKEKSSAEFKAFMESIRQIRIQNQKAAEEKTPIEPQVSEKEKTEPLELPKFEEPIPHIKKCDVCNGDGFYWWPTKISGKKTNLRMRCYCGEQIKKSVEKQPHP